MRDLKATRTSEVPTRWMRLRVFLIGATFLLLLGGAWGRAVMLQVWERDRLRELAQDQYVRNFEVPARRGDIFDRRGVALAQSVEVDSVWADPSMLSDLPQVAKSLARIMKMDEAELRARLTKAKRFVWVKRQASAQEVAAVKGLGLSGLGFTKEPRRFYPQRELAAHVVGMVGTDGRGLDGLEHAFDDELSGQSARMVGIRDARGRKLLTQGLVDTAERQGASVTLTIDRHIQYVTEKALTRAVDEAQAVAGMAVVLDPRTGELLAVANHPRFNPNNPGSSAAAATRNRAVVDTFEPGSTLKPFVVAGALQDRVLRADDTFHCENGRWSVGKHTIGDTHPYGLLSVGRILQVSSNICLAKIGQLLGRERLVDHYRQFGFGERVGLALPGEGVGVIPFPRAEISLATQAFGQGLTVTAIQMAMGYGALANQGRVMRPYLVSKVEDPDGVVLLENQPVVLRQAVDPAVAQQVLVMLEGVVAKEGTGPRARLDEFRVAGKTGTAQKADPVARGYSDKRLASFVGVVPAEAPRAVIAVIIDEPKTDVYGGLVAAPAFKEIAAATMSYLGVPPSRPVPVSLAVKEGVGRRGEAPPGRQPKAVEVRAELAQPLTDKVEEGSVRVPDLSGEVARSAIARLLAVALEPRLSGSGRVVAQTPAPGALVSRGSRVTLELAGGLPPTTK